MKFKKIEKVLITGLGSIGQRHVRNIRKLYGESIKILAYRNRKESPVLNPDMTVQIGMELESTYNIRSFSDLDEALFEKPDVVFITNPNVFHVPIAIIAAKAGCHLYIEKELSHNWDGIDVLSELVKSKKLITYVAYQRRFHPAYKKIKGIIDSGELGNILSVHFNSGECIKDWHPYEDYWDLHAARKDLGGGSLLHQTHELNLLLWYFGIPKKVFTIGGPLSNLKLDVEDSVDILLEFHNNNATVPAHIHVDYLQRPPRRTCEIIGDKAYLQFDFFKNDLIFHHVDQREKDVFSYADFDRDDMFIAALKEFFGCIESHQPTSHDLKEGINNMNVSFAAKESMNTGRVVEINVK